VSAAEREDFHFGGKPVIPSWSQINAIRRWELKRWISAVEGCVCVAPKDLRRDRGWT
jgi:hypothetical protein